MPLFSCNGARAAFAVTARFPDFLMWLEVLISVTVFLILLAFWTRKTVNIPGPVEWPILQNGIETAQNLHRVLGYVLENSRRFNFKVWTFKVPFTPRFIVLPGNPENLRHILQTNFENYPKGPEVYRRLRFLLGDGIFNADGDLWYVQRKTAAHMFSHHMFRDTMGPVFERHCRVLINRLEEVNASRRPADIQRLFFSFTLDSIGEIAFGTVIGALEDPNVPFAQAFDTAQAIVDKRFVNPFFKLTEFLSGDAERLKESTQIMRDFSQRLIDDLRSTGAYMEGSDVLSRFMALKDDKGEYVCLHDDAYLRDVVMNFMIAGRDTTAQALTWTVFMVSQHPEVEARLVAEARRAAPNGETPTYEQAARDFPYFQAVIRETLRLQPSVPKDMKQAKRQDTLPDGTVIPAGSWVVYNPYAMGRNAELWEDPLEFRPERFVEDPKPDQYKYPVFNAGKRTCLGKDMAIFEAVMVLVTLYSRFTVRLEPNRTVEYRESLTLPVNDGLFVTVHRRDETDPNHYSEPIANGN